MKIVLAKPYNKSDHIQPSLGLGYLATAVRSRHDVKLVDGIKERMSVDKLRRFLKEEKPDVLGLQCYTFDVGYIREALAVAKSVRKDMVTVIGGPHPSTLPADMFDRAGSNLDYAFAGE
ncbi:MAG: cobalamin-dependent protein, partial [Candidatus Omnitrophica bacterium]|nr:cobalamin-dependent protein [Candidatus Omnitrophota bacterium]